MTIPDYQKYVKLAQKAAEEAAKGGGPDGWRVSCDESIMYSLLALAINARLSK